MKRILVMLTAMVFTLTTTSAVIAEQSHSTEQTYVIAFKETSRLPGGYQQSIEQAGGKLVRAFPELGVVEAVSTNSDFKGNIEQFQTVQAVNIGNKVYPEKVVFRSEVMPAAVGSPKELYDAYQWDIKRVTNDGDSWALPYGTGLTADGQDIVIAVVDTGIDYNHPDLAANYAYGKSFVPGVPSPGDDHGHGTHIAGLIAANGLVMGVGPDLKIASYRVFGPSGEASTTQVADAIVTAADDNVDVINLSLTGYAWLQDPSSTPKKMAAEVSMFNRAIAYAMNKGVTVVTAAGNSGFGVSSSHNATKQLFGEEAKGETVSTPGNKKAITVSATNDQDELAFYSNYGQMIDVAAPGGDLGPDFLKDADLSKADLTKASFSTYPGGGYQWAIGTSQAVPKVSAIAGLIIAKHGKDQLSPEEVMKTIEKSADSIGSNKYFGNGIVNAVNALNHEH